ncbi:DUF262 domain-containing protein [Deinococcus sp. SM5_A1]|uniref:DUF262 domain-containing protein n=1 Tax=Deinococcus sp. SM5_A1 TaxID=3379094 RepID=UPI00385989B7
MKPETISVFDLFQLPRRYVIPLYQRRYVWTRDKQWAPLWQDISRRAEAELADPQTVKPHFLGAVVFSQVKTFGLDLPTFDVIDGQQRLTTFQLLLAAFRDVVSEMDPSLYAGLCKRLTTVTVNDAYLKEPHHTYKVWPTLFDQPGFTQVLAPGGADDAEVLVHVAEKAFEHVPNTVAAYAYFVGEVRAWLGLDQQPVERAAALLIALTRHLQVVTIDLEDGDDPQVIFETLNARGEPLQPADLVRNHIFSSASALGEDTPRLFNTYWKDFDEDGSFWREQESRGRFVRDRLTWFLVAFLTVKLEDDVSDSMIFDAFKRWWGSRGNETAESGLKELQRYAQVYVSIVQAPYDTRAGVLRRRLAVLEVSSMTPLLLHLVAEVGLKGAALDAILHDLESFLVRRFMLGLGGKNYNLLFLRLLKAVRHLTEPAEIHAQLLDTLSRGTGESVRWPQDAEVIDALKTLPAYRKWKPRGVSMLLEAVDLQLTTDKQEKLLIAGPLSVEHVLPQKWQLWPAPVAPEGVTDPVGWRNALLHTLGNLTLTTQKLNSSVSNSGYDIKREALKEHSVLRLNYRLLKEETWDETVIQRRSRELAGIIVSIWRGPDVAAAVTPEPFKHALEPMVNADDTFEALRAALVARPPTGFRPKSYASGGMQLQSDDWGSVSLRYVLHVAENDSGEDQIILSLEDAFGADTPQKRFMVPLMARLAQPVQLAFGDHRVGFRPNVIDVVLPGDEPVQRVQQALRKLIQITVPAIEAAFTAYRASLTSPGGQSMAHLDVLADTLRPSLPPHFYFMAADTYGGRNYRRIANAAWPLRAWLHYELLQQGDRLLVCLHDEQPKTATHKAAMATLWPQITQAAQTAFPTLAVKDGQKNSGILWLDVPVDDAADSAGVLDILGRLIEATAPVIEQTWDRPVTS